jgi:hypothetical protein
VAGGGRGVRVWGREMYTRGHTAKQKHGVGRVLTTKRVQACARARRIFRTLSNKLLMPNVEMECGNEYEKGGKCTLLPC